MLEGAIFPPISLNLRTDGLFHVIDGAHRVWASKLCGFSHPVAVLNAQR